MPVFTFSGKNESGQKVTGERSAINKQALTSQLRRERITPGSIREKGRPVDPVQAGPGDLHQPEALGGGAHGGSEHKRDEDIHLG